MFIDSEHKSHSDSDILIRGRKNSFFLITAVLIFINICFQVYFFYKYGVGISSDAVNYISASLSFLNKGEFLSFEGKIFSAWPPLFPISLMPFLKIFDKIELAACIYKIIVSSNIILISSYIFKKYFSQISVLALFMILTFTNAFYLRYSVCVGSEDLFILVSLLFLHKVLDYEPHFSRKKNISLKDLCIISALTAIAILIRYNGIILIFVGIIFIFKYSSKPYPFRLKTISIYLIISLIPLVIWMLRNYWLTQTVYGERNPSHINFWENIKYSWMVLSVFYSSAFLSIQSRLVLSAVIIYYLIKTITKRGIKNFIFKFKSIEVLFLYVSIFLAFNITASTFIEFDGMTSRILLPILIPGAIILSYLFYELFLISSKFYLIFILSVWFLQIPTIINIIIKPSQFPILGFNSNDWNNSDLLKYLKQNKEELNYYSNVPEVIYFYTQNYAELTPKNIAKSNMIIFKEQIKCPSKLVWFEKHKTRKKLYPLDSLKSHLKLLPVKYFYDGIIFEINKKEKLL